MEQLKQLQYLSLISKITTGKLWHSKEEPPPLRPGITEKTSFETFSDSCLNYWASAELENNIGISEKTLAEFIVKLSEGKRSVKEFNTVCLLEPVDPG